MANDPLTTLDSMISSIEPGPRLIDGLLLKDLFLLAGDARSAAAIEPGFRMVDQQYLKDLSIEINQVQMEIKFATTGPRLIEGLDWSTLAIAAAGPAIAVFWDDPMLTWDMPGLTWDSPVTPYGVSLDGQTHHEGSSGSEVEPVRPAGEGRREEREGSGVVSDSRQESRQERPRSRLSTWLRGGEGDGESGC